MEQSEIVFWEYDDEGDYECVQVVKLDGFDHINTVLDEDNKRIIVHVYAREAHPPTNR